MKTVILLVLLGSNMQLIKFSDLKTCESFKSAIKKVKILGTMTVGDQGTLECIDPKNEICKDLKENE